MRILLLDADKERSALIAHGASEAGYELRHETAASAGLIAATDGYDIIVIGWALEGLDALEAVRILRRSGIATPILLIMPLAREEDIKAAQAAGSDDCLAPPFAFVDINDRIQSLTGDAAPDVLPPLQVGDLVLDRTARRASRGGQALDLTMREFDILEYLMLREGRVVSRAMLLRDIWHLDRDPGTKRVQTQLSRLRAKIDAPFDRALLQTISGSGYLLSGRL